MRGKSCRSRTLRFETLERRALLAGDVTVTVTNHNVLIQSDNQDDTVVIHGIGNGGIEITSYDGTTINGQNVPFDIPSVNNLTIKMGDGNDHVALASPILVSEVIGGGSQPLQQQPIDIQGNLSVSLGKGTDSIDVEAAYISGGMTVGLGSGNSSVNVYNTTINKNVDIRGGDGNDSINLSGTAVTPLPVSPEPLRTILPFNPILGLGPFQPTPPSHIINRVQMVTLGTIVQGSVSIALGNGADSIGLSQLRVDGSLMMTTGQGRDVISIGVAPTAFTPGSANAASTSAMTATSNTNVIIGGVLSLYTGNGGDDISMDLVQAKGIVLVTGQGADTVSVANATADLFFASLGGGDDTLDVSGGGNTIGNFLAFGGAGNDTFLNATTNSFKHKTLFLFEKLG